MRLAVLALLVAACCHADAPKHPARARAYLHRLEAARAISDEVKRAQALYALARDAAEQALATVVEACVAASDEKRKAGLIADVAPLLSACGREAEALRLARTLTPAQGRDGVLEALARAQDMTPLMRAASKGFTDVVEDLLARKADVNEASVKRVLLCDGVTAAGRGSPPESKQIGVTALMLAASNGHGGAVKALLAGGAKVDAETKTERVTALLVACAKGHKEVVSLLLAKGADPNAQIHLVLGGRRDALVWATYGGHVAVIDLLLKKGASADQALAYARISGRKFLEERLQAGAKKAPAAKAGVEDDKKALRGTWEAPRRLLILGSGASGTSCVHSTLDERGLATRVETWSWGGFKEKDGKRWLTLTADGGAAAEVEYSVDGDKAVFSGGALTGTWKRVKK